MLLNRRSLRQRLGTYYLRDALVSTTTGSWGATASLTVYDSKQANILYSGQQLYERAWLRVLKTGSQTGGIQDAQVASFNTGSGAFHILTLGATTVVSGASYELHRLLPPSEKDIAIDEAVKKIRVLRWEELTIGSSGSHVYSLGEKYRDIVDVRYRLYATGSMVDQTPNWWRLDRDTSGARALFINPVLPLSANLMLYAVTVPTLGAYDDDTIEVPSEEWVLAGAAAAAYWMLEARAPAAETKAYQDRRRELSASFVRLSRQFSSQYKSQKIQLDNFD